jgi:hypothetical protein
LDHKEQGKDGVTREECVSLKSALFLSSGGRHTDWGTQEQSMTA